MFRDRPFNLKGGGVMVFCFVQKKKIPTTRELEFFFFGRAKHKFFFKNLTLDYMTKTFYQIIFVFLHQNQNIFFSNIGNQNIFLEKKTITPPLQVKWSFPYCICFCCCFFLSFCRVYPQKNLIQQTFIILNWI